MNPTNGLTPGELDAREDALRQDGYLLGIAIVSLVNGMAFSPWFDVFVVPVAALMAGFGFSSQLIAFYLTSLILALSTVILAGVPAALFERFTGRTRSDPASLLVWLGAAFLLSLPAFARLLGFA